MKLYDTLSGNETEFVPSNGKVKMYVCGITPYAPSHLGHGMSYVIFDVLRRYLEYLGYSVEYVQNFTDIDDKIIQKAKQQGIEPHELAERYIEEFRGNMEALNVKPSDHTPLATEEIPDMINIIGSLIGKGYAYVSEGDVYFRVTKVAHYGKLGRRTIEGMMAGARVEVDNKKDHPMDFALWKAAKPGEPSWESPWGPGRPGWHIECTAMALEYLGETLDIHGGGQDLIFPHHENETAQSEAFTEAVPFARYWVHHGLLQLGEDKMSKSLGNLVSLNEAVQRHSTDALRLFFLGSHYRNPLTYSEEALESAGKAAERLRNPLREGSRNGNGGLDPIPYRERFLKAMDADLNTPQAIAALFDLAREINRARESRKDVTEAQRTLRELGNILGLTFREPAHDPSQDNTGPFIELLINTRAELRASRQFEIADNIRRQLAGMGIELEDTPKGTEWRYR